MDDVLPGYGFNLNQRVSFPLEVELEFPTWAWVQATAGTAFGSGLNSSSGGELKLYLRCTGSTNQRDRVNDVIVEIGPYYSILKICHALVNISHAPPPGQSVFLTYFCKTLGTAAVTVNFLFHNSGADPRYLGGPLFGHFFPKTAWK